MRNLILESWVDLNVVVWRCSAWICCSAAAARSDASAAVGCSCLAWAELALAVCSVLERHCSLAAYTHCSSLVADSDFL